MTAERDREKLQSRDMLPEAPHTQRECDDVTAEDTQAKRTINDTGQAPEVVLRSPKSTKI